MLSYNQTIEKIKSIAEELKTLEIKTDIYKHREILREYHKNGNTEAIKKAEAGFLKDAEKEQTLKHHLKVYNFNAEKLFILENIQIIIDIFNGFKGKKCGEKTREKIRAEVKEKCGCDLSALNLTFFDENVGDCFNRLVEEKVWFMKFYS